MLKRSYELKDILIVDLCWFDYPFSLALTLTLLFSDLNDVNFVRSQVNCAPVEAKLHS